jgi:hypothetical protein
MEKQNKRKWLEYVYIDTERKEIVDPLLGH